MWTQSVEGLIYVGKYSELYEKFVKTHSKRDREVSRPGLNASCVEVNELV